MGDGWLGRGNASLMPRVCCGMMWNAPVVAIDFSMVPDLDPNHPLERGIRHGHQKAH
jgi:hypothetical protein